jgi:hypothetical protein
MGHVERVEISGFKCLSAVDFDCGQFNVLTGRNGTGKTSILEAIQLAHDPTALQNYDPAAGRLIEVKESTGSVEIDRLDDTLQFSIECVGLNTALPLASESAVRNTLILDSNGDLIEVLDADGGNEIVANFEQHLEDSGTDPTDSVVEIRTGEDVQKFVSDSREVRRELREFIDQIDFSDQEEQTDKLFSSSGHRFVGEPPVSEPVRLVDPTSSSDPPADADSELRRVRVREFLRDHDILPNLESFSFDELVFDEDGEQYAIPYDFLGEGTKTITSLVWQLLSEEDIPDVILLEEPENHLHPGYVKELVEFLIEFARDEDVQLFVTTHNVDFLREFFNDATVGDHEAWLGEEFRLIQTTELSPKQFDYERAREHVRSYS